MTHKLSVILKKLVEYGIMGFQPEILALAIFQLPSDMRSQVF